MTFLGVALYAVFVMTAPFEHHDFDCHLKTPQHCTSCTSSQLGSDPQALATLDTWHLHDAGRAITIQVVAAGVLLPAQSTGRSPPSHS